MHGRLSISNNNNRYDSNPLGNAVTDGDGKVSFLWKQTTNALIITLRSHAMLIQALLAERSEFVMTRRLQSDPIENLFSQYRQMMSGERYLVSLRKVQSSERILACSSLLKIGIKT